MKLICRECEIVIGELIFTDEYPHGAIKIVSRHHGERHVTVVSLDKIMSQDFSILAQVPIMAKCNQVPA